MDLCFLSLYLNRCTKQKLWFARDKIYTRNAYEKDALAISQAAQKRVSLFKMDRQTHWQEAQEIWIKDSVKIVNMKHSSPIYVRAREKCITAWLPFSKADGGITTTHSLIEVGKVRALELLPSFILDID